MKFEECGWKELYLSYRDDFHIDFDLLTQNPTGIKYLMNPIMLCSCMKFQVIGIFKKWEKANLPK